jgi:hypothetical protein
VTDVVYGAETCVRVGACTCRQRVTPSVPKRFVLCRATEANRVAGLLAERSAADDPASVMGTVCGD